MSNEQNWPCYNNQLHLKKKKKVTFLSNEICKYDI